MQKIVNIVAVTSGLVSAAVVARGIYVYVQRDQLIDNVKSQVMEAVTGSFGGLGGGLGGDALPVGAPDLAPPADQAAAPAAPTGLGLPQ